MARSTRISLPYARTGDLVRELGEVSGVLGISVERGGAVMPQGDVLIIESTTRALPDILGVLHQRGVLSDPQASVTTSEPQSAVSVTATDPLRDDVSDNSFEEMEYTLGKESNMTVNGVLLMAASGAIAAFGLLTDALHLVVAGAIIAPGFEPLSRIGLGLVGQNRRTVRRGLVHSLRAYLALIAAAALAALVIRVVGGPIAGTAYLASNALSAYWSKVTWLSSVNALVAGLAGALLIATGRSILTAGVMTALGLIPSAALVGIALAYLDASLAGEAFSRLLLEAILVALSSVAVFGWKRAQIHRRPLAR